MASTRSIRVLFLPLAKSVVTAASMLNECAINSRNESRKSCQLTKILLLGYKEVRSQHTYSDVFWAHGKSLD